MTRYKRHPKYNDKTIHGFEIFAELQSEPRDIFGIQLAECLYLTWWTLVGENDHNPWLCAKLLIHTGGVMRNKLGNPTLSNQCLGAKGWIMDHCWESTVGSNRKPVRHLSPCPLSLSLKSGDHGNPMLRGGVPWRVLGETRPDCLGGFRLTRCVARWESVGVGGPRSSLVRFGWLRISILSKPNLTYPKTKLAVRPNWNCSSIFVFSVFCLLGLCRKFERSLGKQRSVSMKVIPRCLSKIIPS